MINFMLCFLLVFFVAVFSDKKNRILNQLTYEVNSIKQQLIAANIAITLSKAPRDLEKEDIFVLNAVKGDQASELFSSARMGKMRLFSAAAWIKNFLTKHNNLLWQHSCK